MTFHDGCYHVFRIGYENSPRKFISLNDRCSCTKSMAYQQQCVHELVLHDGNFILDLFHKRWHRRRNVTKLKNIGNYKNLKCS